MRSILDYIKVFKNIETYKGPGPRNMYAGGQLVRNTADGSRPGYAGVKIFEHKTQEGKIYSGQPYVRDSTKKKKLPPNSIRRGEKIIFLGDDAMAGAEAFSKTFKSQGGDLKLLKELIVESNKGFKFEKIIDLQEKAGFSRKTSFNPKLNIYGSIDTLEDKMKKAFEHVMGDPNKPVNQMFDPMTQVKKLIGTNESPGRILKGWAPYEESKRLIKNLAVPLSKQRLSKLGDLTLGELDFRINNDVKAELLYSAPRKSTNETKIFDIVKRHVDQGGKELEWITKPGKTELGYPSYSEAKFKYKGKTYDMAELINNAETDPNFKEFFQAQKDYKKINGKIVKHPKTGKNIKFGDLMQEVYGHKRPYAVDHAGSILKEPFSNLRVLPNRINAAAGTISLYTDKFIVDPLKKGKYTEAGKASQLEKIGYNFNQSIDDLIKAEMNLANDVLVKGRVLRTPNQIIDSLRQGENYVPDFYTKSVKPGIGFAKQIEKGGVTLGSNLANVDADMFDFRKLPEDMRHFADVTKKFAAQSPKFLSALKKAKGVGKWTGLALATEPLWAVPFTGYEYLAGESPEKMLGTATWGLAGETASEELKKATGELGYATQQIDDYGSQLQALENKYHSLNDQNDPRGEQRQMIKNLYEHTRGKYGKAYNMFVDDQGQFDKGKYDQALNTYTAGLVQIDKFKKQLADERMDKLVEKGERYLPEGYDPQNPLTDDVIRNIKGYMGGGMVGIRKPNAIAPTGGPMSQGLRSLYNNVRKR